MSSQLATILAHQKLGELHTHFASHEIDDSLLPTLTDDDLQKIGIDKLGHRKKLLAAFGGDLANAPSPPRVFCADPALARRDHPFVNGLGQPFVPVPGFTTLFCIWPLRVQDYRFYCEETGAEYPSCDFKQGPEHPAVNVTWHEATAFCQWLTERERGRGIIKNSVAYRLPGDREWSAAVGLPRESGKTPAARNDRTPGYPWGGQYPPPRGAGNYHPSLEMDDFRETSPVGTFSANAFGIHDLGGNVWEWCMDLYDHEHEHKVLRGASCFNDYEDYLMSSHRDRNLPDNRRNNNGIRLVLAASQAPASWA